MAMAVWQKKGLRIICIGIIILILLGIITSLTVLLLDYFNIVDVEILKTNLLQVFHTNEADGKNAEEDPVDNELQVLGEKIVELEQENISLRDEVKQKSNEVLELIQELDQLQTKLVELENEKQSKTRVAEIYKKMRPQQAAAILEKLTEEEALAILKILDAQQVSQIMAQLDPNRAATLTRGMNNPKGGD
ncbi:MAG: hypothetical protein GX376_02275 [Firmicutes bacterium]|nr:hypothetical protein [Bacillota bacterium]